ncbi:MAG: flagellar biosynthesis protein FliQ [Spirochaetales bacterium]|nr:MAG: flagellar biosynthesis protein FliQ [Spirochaetales bacterium]
MEVGEAVFIMRGAILQILLLSAPMLLIGMAVGLIISVIQATTSIQEQTLTFVPKIAAILLALMLFGPWIFSSMTQYTLTLFNRIQEMSP